MNDEWVLASAKDFLVAVGELAVYALDQLYLDDRAGGCCPICCAPCSALSTLLEKGFLDRLVAGVDDAAEGSVWWVDGRVDRDFLIRAWRLTICHDPDEII